MVDWGRSAVGDSMQELAYLAYFTDHDAARLLALLDRYGAVNPAERQRAGVYLMLLHAHFFVEEYLGLEPERSMAPAEKMTYLWALLQTDIAQRGLTDLSLSTH